MTRPIKDLAKSVHTRLLNLAKQTGRPFSELLQLYAMERFLYRLGHSSQAPNFVLKGGLMLRVWKAPITRPTRDVDLLGRTLNTVANLVSIVRQLCVEEVEPDGMRFDPTTVAGSVINEDAEYNGVRVKFAGLLGVARASMQIDVGFGDAVVPAPVDIEVPTLLGYQRETTIAEKFHAMVVLGSINGRMKDFYDLWLLAQNFDFEAQQLTRAITATFAARETSLEANPIALTPGFAASSEVQKRWEAFLKKSALTDAPPSFAEIVLVIRGFLSPVVNPPVAGRWRRGGPWSS